LKQYQSEPYLTINRLVLETEDASALASKGDDIEDIIKRDQLDRYRTYLKRCIKSHKIAERAEMLSKSIASKLQGQSSGKLPPLIHTSASEYMGWLTNPKLTFENQPDLSIEETGIPQLRKALLSVPADQNIHDYEKHIYSVRTVKRNLPDGGFRTIAEAVEVAGPKFLVPLETEVTAVFKELSDKSTEKIHADIPSIRKKVDTKLEIEWCQLKFFQFNGAMKGRGVFASGPKRAKDERNMDRELADLLAPPINKWCNAHSLHMASMQVALCQAVDQLHQRIMTVLADVGGNW
jgi:hypothetical protein